MERCDQIVMAGRSGRIKSERKEEEEDNKILDMVYIFAYSPEDNERVDVENHSKESKP